LTSIVLVLRLTRPLCNSVSSEDLNIQIGDGRRLLELQPQLFDYIVLDAFTSSGVPSHLCTLQFFSLVLSKLRPTGALLINLTGRGKQDVKSGAIYVTLQQVFNC